MRSGKIWLIWSLVLVLAGCYGEAASEARPKVLIIGDSMIGVTSEELDATLGPTYAIDVVARDGERIDQLIPRLEKQLADAQDEAEIVIVNAGTNDAIQAHPSWESSFDAMLSLIEHHRCVVYVTIEDVLDLRPSANGTAAAINARIRREATSRPNVRVADWDAVIDAHPEYLIDGIHPYYDGQQVLADLIRDTLLTCPAT